MFLVSFFWLPGLQCLLLPLPPSLPFLMPSSHSVLFALSRKICKILRAGFPMLDGVGILPLLFSSLEDLLFLSSSEREGPWAGCWAMNSLWGWGSLLSGALGPARRVTREAEMDQKSWREYWKDCMCLRLYFGCQMCHKMHLKSSTNSGNWFFILRDTYLLMTISSSS